MPNQLTNPDELVPVGVLCEWLGLSEQRVGKAVKAGIIKKGGRGLYPLQPNVRAYCQHMADTAGARAVAKDTPTLTAERIRLTREKADQAAILSARQRGELVSVAEVASQWSAILSALRSRVLSIAPRVQQRVGTLEKVVAAAIADECRDALTELSDEDSWEL